jgi:hypothetical protein
MRKLKIMATKLMLHRTSADRLPSILEGGLCLDMPVNMTEAGTWSHLWYDGNPVFLAMPDAPFLVSTTFDNADVELSVDVDELILVADLPSLCDTGAYVDDGIMWWKCGSEPAGLMPYLDEEGSIEIEYLLDPDSEACQAAMEITKTAACLSVIPPSRLVVNMAKHRPTF